MRVDQGLASYIEVSLLSPVLHASPQRTNAGSSNYGADRP
jgi:hypothetical protein